ASPLAKKLAAEKGVDLKYVKGSGDNGRITKSDVDGFLATPIVAPVAQPAVTSAPSINVAKPTIPAAPAGVVSFDDVPV
ncbi:E3 binding domain-containing protein, partial [Acinetobacter baumannii]